LKQNIKVLIGRIDHIGDMLLTLPIVGLLKQHYPPATVDILAKEYVKDIVLASRFVDEFLSWETLCKLSSLEAPALLALKKYDVFMAADRNRALIELAKKAKIPLRIIMSRDDRRWLSNHRFRNWLQGNYVVKTPHFLSLHQSLLHTYLLKPLGIHPLDTLPNILPFFQQLTLKKQHQEPLGDPAKFNLIIHPGSHGNGHEWPLENYGRLIKTLPKHRFNIFITGSSSEAKLYSDYLSQQVPEAILLLGKTNVSELMHFIAIADGLIASSTGPLHLAAALKIRVLGLYPTASMVNAWGPLGENADWLLPDQLCQKPLSCLSTHCACMKAIRVERVRAQVLAWASQK
jgi:heptosyltransferase-3